MTIKNEERTKEVMRRQMYLFALTKTYPIKSLIERIRINQEVRAYVATKVHNEILNLKRIKRSGLEIDEAMLERLVEIYNGIKEAK